MENTGINPNLFVVYIDKGRNSPQKVMERSGELLAYIDRYIKKPGERWMILPADRTEVVYISPYFLTKEDGQAFEELKESIYKMIEDGKK